MSSSVVRGCLEEVLSRVVGTDGLDVYAMMNGKILHLRSTLRFCGIHIHYRLRGGSREDVPGQWTCSQCFAPRCWPVRKRCYRCGAAREELPVSSKEKGNGKGDTAVGPLGRKPPPTRLANRKSCLLGVLLERELGALQLLERLLYLPLKIWSRHSSSSRVS